METEIVATVDVAEIRQALDKALYAWDDTHDYEDAWSALVGRLVALCHMGEQWAETERRDKQVVAKVRAERAERVAVAAEHEQVKALVEQADEALRAHDARVAALNGA